MSTRPFVPRADNEGSLGTSQKKWGNVYATEGNIANRNIRADGAKIDNHESSINSLQGRVTTLEHAYAGPLVAHTAAEMTDTEKVYVYVGNEEGYLNGHWYYYDGSAWADGGVYNAAAIETDKTLSVSGEAADAKVVGDRLVRDETKILGLSSDVNYLYVENRQQTDTINQMKTSMELKAVGLTDNDGVNFADMDSANINAFEYLPITDKTLSIEDIPADAAAVKNAMAFNYANYEWIYGWNSGGASWQTNSITHIPILSVRGTIPTSKDDGKLKVDYSFSLNRMSGKGTLGIQGQSSTAFPKKNYNIKFANNVVLKSGWIPAKSYTLKGNFTDFTYARNTVNARLWGQCVKNRAWQKDSIADATGIVIKDNNGDAMQVYDSILPGLVNGGATDGFPIFLVLNGEYAGLYILQIKKDPEMFWMGSNDNECILGCEGGGNGSPVFKELANIDDRDFTYEYCPEGEEETMKTSFNRMIQACIDSTGNNYEDTLGQYLDMDSIIDYMLFSSLIAGIDIITKNYLMVTYDGIKWYMSAYDLDNAFGSYQDGSINLPTTIHPTPAYWDAANRAMHLAYTYDSARVKARYDELRRTVFSESNVYLQFTAFAREMPLAAKIAETKLYPNTPSTNEMNLSQILNFYRLRVAYLDEQMAALG